MQAAVKFLLKKAIEEIEANQTVISNGRDFFLEVTESVVVSVGGFHSEIEAQEFWGTTQTVFDQVFKQRLQQHEIAERLIATINFEINFK